VQHVHKTEKERTIAELTERLRVAESLLVADYRGLTNSQLAELRSKLRANGAKLSVVKNTLTRIAAREAGADALLALLEGPSAIAFVEADGDPVAVAKALSDTAKDTKILVLRGGVMSGRAITESDVEELAKLPPADVLKGQLVGVILAPLNQLAALLNAPLQDLVGLIDARIEQLGGEGPGPAAEETSSAEAPAQEAEATAEAVAEEATTEAETEAAAAPNDDVPAAEADEPAVEETPQTASAEGADDTDSEGEA
jgi:large subunit ribosomal protein L10